MIDIAFDSTFIHFMTVYIIGYFVGFKIRTTKQFLEKI